MENSNIKIEDIKKYIEDVYKFNGGELFTLKSIKNKGFTHTFENTKIENIKIGDYFFNNLISTDPRIRCRKINGNTLFRKGKESVSIGDFIEYEIKKVKKIEIDELHCYLNKFYGINIERSKLIEQIKERDIYYNLEDKMIYINYDEYLKGNKKI